jgi:hypothetical protein
VKGFDGRQPPQPRSDDDTHPMGIGRRDFELSVFHGHDRRGHGVLDKDVHPLHLFFIDEVLRYEILHFRGDLGVKSRGVEFGDLAHTGLSLEERLPALFHPGPQRRDHSESSDHHSSTRHKTSR